jgi:hypothetical protein
MAPQLACVVECVTLQNCVLSRGLLRLAAGSIPAAARAVGQPQAGDDSVQPVAVLGSLLQPPSLVTLLSRTLALKWYLVGDDVSRRALVTYVVTAFLE